MTSAPAPGGDDPEFKSFPSLKTNEIITELKQLEVDLTPEEIAKPQPGKVQDVYLTFLDTLSGTVTEMLEAQRDQVTDGVENREIYDGGLVRLFIYREVRAMMVAAQVFDFHLQDLTRPQSKRFKRDLCALINFFRFRSDRLAEFDELVVGTEELVDRRAQLEVLTAQVQESIASLEAQQASEQEEADKLRETNLKYSNTLLHLRKVQTELLAEADQLQKDKTDAHVRHQAAKDAMDEVSAALHKLQKRITSSPAVVRSEIARLQREVEEARASLKEKEQQAHALASKKHALDKLEQDLVAAVASMEQVAAQMDQAARASQALEEARLEDAKQQNLQDTYQDQIAELERSLEQMAARLASDRATRETKRASNDAELASLTEQIHAVSDQTKERQALVEKTNQQVADVERQQAVLLEEHDAYCAEMHAKKEIVCDWAQNYMEALSRVLPSS